jgi:CheY-like chemotaxis protein
VNPQTSGRMPWRLGAADICGLLGVQRRDLARWLRSGDLPSVEAPGGARQVHAFDLVAFLAARGLPVPEALERAAHRRLLAIGGDAHDVQVVREAPQWSRRLFVEAYGEVVAGLVRAVTWRPDVLLIDWRRTDADVLEVCRRVRATPELTTTKILVARERVTAADASRAYRAGAHRVVSKPMDPMFLAVMVDDVDEWHLTDAECCHQEAEEERHIETAVAHTLAAAGAQQGPRRRR